MTAVNVILAAEQRGRLVEQGGWNSRKITGQAVDLLVDVRFHQMKDAAFRELIWLRGHTVLHKPVGKPVFQWIGDKVQALWGWFTDLLTPVKSTSAELQSAAAMGRRFGEALAEGLNMVMHPLDSLKSGVSWLLEKLGIVSKEAAKAKLPESVTRQQPATVNADGKVMMPSGGFPSWGYGFAGMYDSGGYIPRGQFGIVGENGPEIVNGPANVTSRRNTAALAAVVAGMMGVAAAPAELPPLHPLALPAKGGEAIVSRAATVPLVQRIEAPTQIIIQTQPGQSAQDIAREVARQLDERERRLKAKARSNYSDQGGYDA